MSVLVQTVQTSDCKSVVGWLPRSIVTQKSCARWSARHAVTVECVQSQTRVRTTTAAWPRDALAAFDGSSPKPTLKAQKSHKDLQAKL